jgi:hypothetical protein
MRRWRAARATHNRSTAEEEVVMPRFRKVDPTQVALTSRPRSERARVAQEYNALLEGFAVGDHGRAELVDGERRLLVRQRLQAAARQRDLALRFRPGRGPLIFRVDAAPPRPSERIPSPAAEPPSQENGHSAAQRAPVQRRPHRERRPTAGRYDAMLPRWMREGQPQGRRAGSKRRVK